MPAGSRTLSADTRRRSPGSASRIRSARRRTQWSGSRSSSSTEGKRVSVGRCSRKPWRSSSSFHRGRSLPGRSPRAPVLRSSPGDIRRSSRGLTERSSWPGRSERRPRLPEGERFEGVGAMEFCESVLRRARPLEDPPLVMWAMIATAVARLAAGDRSGAVALVREALELTRGDVVVRAGELPQLVRLSVAAGDLDLAERALEGTDALALERYRLSLLSARAALTEGRGETKAALSRYEDAAVAWARWGHVLELAHALFGAGRCLDKLGRLGEARERFEAAAAAFSRLGAEPSLAEVRSAMGQDALNPRPA